MHYTLNLPQQELAKFPTKGGILTKNGPYEPGDTIHLTAGKQQVSMEVLEVEVLNTRNCILWLRKPPGSMLRAAGGIPPDVPTLDRQDELPMFGKTEKEVGDE